MFTTTHTKLRSLTQTALLDKKLARHGGVALSSQGERFVVPPRCANSPVSETFARLCHDVGKASGTYLRIAKDRNDPNAHWRLSHQEHMGRWYWSLRRWYMRGGRFHPCGKESGFTLDRTALALLSAVFTNETTHCMDTQQQWNMGHEDA